MEATSVSGFPDPLAGEISDPNGFVNVEARMMADGFMTSSILPRHPGGHAIAMPSLAIVPMLYHKPPDYDAMSRTGRPVDRDDRSEDRELFQEDDYGTLWKIKSSERREHNHTMKCVKKHASDGLLDMADVKYYEAVGKFDDALSALWPCHRNTLLERWIQVHCGHALLRAGLLECPEIYGESTSELIQRSFETFSKCVGPLRSLHNVDDAARAFNSSLFFSGLLGLAWISFFRGNLEEAENYVDEMQTVRLEPKHMRSYISPRERSFMRTKEARREKPPTDMDTFFLKAALCQATETLDDLKGLFAGVGFELSKHQEDCILTELLGKELLDMEGKFDSSVNVSAKHAFGPERYDEITRPAVAGFLDRVEAGYSGNTWFAVGANQQARAAYECALASGSVLLRAAASVGLGNVFMRLVASVGDEETGFAKAERKYKEALKIYDELGFKVGQAIVQCNLGNLYHKRGHLEHALQQYAMVKTCYTGKMGTGLAALHLRLKLAELHLDMEDWEKQAFDSIREAARFSSARNNPSARAWIEHLSGSYYLKKAMITTQESKQDLTSAKSHLQDAIKFLAGIQVHLRYESSLKLVLFERQKETYTLLLWCIACELDKSGSSAVEALVWCERSRSRLSIGVWWNRFFPSIREFLADDLAVLDALKVTASINDTMPYEESWKYLQVLLSRCQPLVPVATAVVEYALCADFGFLIFVLNTLDGEPKMLRVSFEEQKLNREKLDALVNRTVFLLGPKPSVEKEEEELEANLVFLHKLLIKPVEQWLKKTQEIIVIPHDILFKVPFHALIDGEKQFLIQRYSLSYAESIRSFVQCSLLWDRNERSRQVRHSSGQDDKKARKRWLVVGINKHRPALADLKYAEREATEVDSLLRSVFESSDGQVFLGSGATKSQVVPHFAQAEIIHLATHGVVNAKYERGGILFKTSSSEVVETSTAETFETSVRSVADYHDIAYNHRMAVQSGSLGEAVVLSANEISEMDLGAQLVVLSACQSANGVILGEGVSGLGRALLEAGVPCTMLSLWPVSDQWTIRFMAEFYKRLAQGLPVGGAAKAAMETMIEERNDYGDRKCTVRHWAAFLAYGFPHVRIADASQLRLPQQQNSSGILLKIGAFALARFSRRKDVTRSNDIVSEAPVSYAWNPLPRKLPKFRSLASLPSEKELVIVRLFAFYLICTQLDHDASHRRF